MIANVVRRHRVLSGICTSLQRPSANSALPAASATAPHAPETTSTCDIHGVPEYPSAMPEQLTHTTRIELIRSQIPLHHVGHGAWPVPTRRSGTAKPPLRPTASSTRRWYHRSAISRRPRRDALRQVKHVPTVLAPPAPCSSTSASRRNLPGSLDAPSGGTTVRMPR